MSKIKYFLMTICLFSCLLPVIANAWNFTGHVVIAQIAYDNLTPAKKVKADQLGKLIFSELPTEQQEKLNYHYPNASDFEKVAVMPDVWRKWRLSTLFEKFHATLPLNLLFYSNQPTASWHFVDEAYPKPSFCHTNQATNAIWAIKKLQSDLSPKNGAITQALIMVLLEHYVGDIHQPLHTLTNVNVGCGGDRGGNLYCLKMNRRGKCSKNLHSLWDSAVGYLRPHENIQQLAYVLEQLHPISEYTVQLQEGDPSSWANESRMNATFIYSTPENSKPSSDYYHKGQLVAKSQLALAGYRLASVLNKIL